MVNKYIHICWNTGIPADWQLVAVMYKETKQCPKKIKEEEDYYLAIMSVNNAEFNVFEMWLL